MANYQVIVLYANLDNKPSKENNAGWVSLLVDNVSKLLGRLTGGEYSIIPVNEYDLDPDVFPVKPSIIIPIFSIGFFQTPIFQPYLDVLISESSKKKTDIKFINVFKNRPKAEDIPTYLLNQHSTNYYTVDSLTDYVSEIKFLDDPERDHNFWMKTFDLVYDIMKLESGQKSLLDNAEEMVSRMSPSGIYLAQAGIDLQIERENIYRELIRNKYPVYQLEFPDLSGNDIEEEIYEKLNKCYMSIHLVGEDLGKFIKSKGLSILEIENKICSDHSQQVNKKSGIKFADRFNRIVWLAPNRENLSVKQKLFIDALRKEFSNLHNTEILEFPIEDLKGFINAKIDIHLKGRESGKNFDRETQKSIYFICDKTEFSACKPIGNILENQGFNVVYSSFEGELLQIRQDHTKNLRECDGTLIFYGNNSKNWVKSKLFDSIKSLGLGREKATNPTAIIVDSEKKIDIDLQIDKEGVFLLENNKLNKASFEPFIDKLRADS